jgi:hypothetical protein
MPSELISGPAGAGKTQAAREELGATNEPTVAADFQSLYAALLLLERDPDTGRYPERREADAHALRMAEYLRRAILTAAAARGLRVLATNSDGDLDRRAFLLRELGPGATERVIDPGRAIVTERLGIEGETTAQCQAAIERWYSRGRRGPLTL